MIARIDKYLWSVRLFKTRSQATEACKSAKVIVNGKAAKASRDITVGTIIFLKKEGLNLSFEVIDPIQKRVGAKLVEQFLKDLTPKEEYNKMELMKQNFEYRDRGIGRPTKKDRRVILKIKQNDD